MFIITWIDSSGVSNFKRWCLIILLRQLPDLGI